MLAKINKDKITLPKRRRQYISTFGMDGGLDYSKATTVIGDKFTPNCDEMTFRNGVMSKAKGSNYYANTNTTPLLGKFMYAKSYDLTTNVKQLIVHTTKNDYVYNSSSDLLECITRGVVVEDCEDVWAVNANVTVALDTDKRKGTNSNKFTIDATFTTGIASYENFASLDISTYTHLHIYVKSDVVTLSGDLKIRISEQNAGGTGATYEDLVVPALVAGVWQEVSIALGTPADLDAVLSVSLIVSTDNGAQIINIDDVMAITEKTGDEDNVIATSTINDYYVKNNGIAPLEYWDTTSASFLTLLGGENLTARAMGKYGERLVLFNVTDTGTAYPRRVQWTAVGGLSITPVATDWTKAGSGNTDLESTIGTDNIQNALKLGNYYVVYGERVIVLMDYTGKVSSPYAFYTRVSLVGLAAPRAVVNMGNNHIFLGWDDIYLYSGGKDIIRIGNNIKDELFSVVSPTYINRCFMVYDELTNEIKLYYPTTADTSPTKYFLLNLNNKSWSKGTRVYTGYGKYTKSISETWDSIGDDANTTWNAMTSEVRWDDTILESLSPIILLGDGSGKIEENDESTNNLVGNVIDGYCETKDFTTGRYKSTLTNWMEFGFEARGDTLNISYSIDEGASWSNSVAYTLTSSWAKYRFDINVNSSMIRFRFENNTVSEDFEVRWVENGLVEASDRGM